MFAPIIISALGEYSNVSNYFSFKDNCVLANSLQGEAASVRWVKITLLLLIKKETYFTELC